MDDEVDGVPAIKVNRAEGPSAILHRYEIVKNGLVRRRFVDRRPFVDGEVTLIDVLLNEDEAGRYLGSVRGFKAREPDPAGLGHATDSRDVSVDVSVILAISRDLRVGPHARRPVRLATLNGSRIP